MVSHIGENNETKKEPESNRHITAYLVGIFHQTTVLLLEV